MKCYIFEYEKEYLGVLGTETNIIKRNQLLSLQPRLDINKLNLFKTISIPQTNKDYYIKELKLIMGDMFLTSEFRKINEDELLRKLEYIKSNIENQKKDKITIVGIKHLTKMTRKQLTRWCLARGITSRTRIQTVVNRVNGYITKNYPNLPVIK